ncbi:hypothetical protein Tco_1433909 [Tanacetum coccineum]
MDPVIPPIVTPLIKPPTSPSDAPLPIDPIILPDYQTTTFVFAPQEDVHTETMVEARLDDQNEMIGEMYEQLLDITLTRLETIEHDSRAVRESSLLAQQDIDGLQTALKHEVNRANAAEGPEATRPARGIVRRNTTPEVRSCTYKNFLKLQSPHLQ